MTFNCSPYAKEFIPSSSVNFFAQRSFSLGQKDGNPAGTEKDFGGSWGDHVAEAERPNETTQPKTSGLVLHVNAPEFVPRSFIAATDGRSGVATAVYADKTDVYQQDNGRYDRFGQKMPPVSFNAPFNKQYQGEHAGNKRWTRPGSIPGNPSRVPINEDKQTANQNQHFERPRFTAQGNQDIRSKNSAVSRGNAHYRRLPQQKNEPTCDTKAYREAWPAHNSIQSGQERGRNSNKHKPRDSIGGYNSKFQNVTERSLASERGNIPTEIDRGDSKAINKHAKSGSGAGEGLKSWRDVVQSKPEEDSRDFSGRGNNDKMKDRSRTVSFEKSGHQVVRNRNASYSARQDTPRSKNSNTPHEPQSTVKNPIIRSSQQQHPLSNKQSEEVLEWRRRTPESSSRDNQKRSDRKAFEKTRKETSRNKDRFNKTKNCELGTVPEHFAKQIKEILFSGKSGSQISSSVTNVNENSRKFRNWYNSFENFPEALQIPRTLNPRKTWASASEKQESITGLNNRSVRQPNHREDRISGQDASFKGNNVRQSHNANLSSNTKTFSYSKIVSSNRSQDARQGSLSSNQNQGSFDRSSDQNWASSQSSSAALKREQGVQPGSRDNKHDIARIAPERQGSKSYSQLHTSMHKPERPHSSFPLRRSNFLSGQSPADLISDKRSSTQISKKNNERQSGFGENAHSFKKNVLEQKGQNFYPEPERSKLITERSKGNIERSKVDIEGSKVDIDRSKVNKERLRNNFEKSNDTVERSKSNKERSKAKVQSTISVETSQIKRSKETLITVDEDADAWEDIGDWVTVERKQKPKTVDKNENMAEEFFIAPQNDIERGTKVGNETSRYEKSVRRKETVKKGDAKPKKENKRKKKKRKENVLYENDEKKTREFKMIQLIEENLKQNMIELTRTKKKHLVEESDVADGAESDWPSIGSAVPVSQPIFSYMDALKKVPVRKLSRPNETVFNVISSASLSLEERQLQRRMRFKEKRKQKKKEKKLKKREEAEDVGVVNPDVPLENRPPLSLDLGSMFEKLLKPEKPNETEPMPFYSKSAKKNTVSTGVISVVSGLAKKNRNDGRRMETSKAMASLNALDSTQPQMRGKEKEKPKKKKPTLLKRIIMREREAKKLLRELENIKTEDTKPATEVSSTRENTLDSKKDLLNGSNCKREVKEELKDQKNFIEANVNIKKEPADFSEALGKTSNPLSNVPLEVLKKIHSRKFRMYCDHFLSKEIDSLVFHMLKDLQRFQTRAIIENPIKAKTKRRYVLGLREVYKHIRMKKLKCVIIASNLEQICAQGGIDDILGNILTECRLLSVPVVYSMSRQALGLTLNRKVPVSAIGIFSYDGSEKNFHEMKSLVEEQRDKYGLKVAELTSLKLEQ